MLHKQNVAWNVPGLCLQRVSSLFSDSSRHPEPALITLEKNERCFLIFKHTNCQSLSLRCVAQSAAWRFPHREWRGLPLSDQQQQRNAMMKQLLFASRLLCSVFWSPGWGKAKSKVKQPRVSIRSFSSFGCFSWKLNCCNSFLIPSLCFSACQKSWRRRCTHLLPDPLCSCSGVSAHVQMWFFKRKSWPKDFSLAI